MSEVKKRNKKKKWRRRRSRSQSTNQKCQSLPAYFTLGGWQKVSPGLKRSTHIAWKELRQLLFSETFGGLSRDAPAKLPLCDAEGMLEHSLKQRITVFPPCLEKSMTRGKKVANSGRGRDRASAHTSGLGAAFSNTNTPNTPSCVKESSEAAGPPFFFHTGPRVSRLRK